VNTYSKDKAQRPIKTLPYDDLFVNTGLNINRLTINTS